MTSQCLDICTKNYYIFLTIIQRIQKHPKIQENIYDREVQGYRRFFIQKRRANIYHIEIQRSGHSSIW